MDKGRNKSLWLRIYDFCFVQVLLLVISLLVFNIRATCQRPNVILVIADDFRYDWMHHKGKEYLRTPVLDRLSREGWSFPNAFCSGGLCSPSRASILTGKSIHQASAPDITWQNNSFLETQTMFPQRLHDHGYRTGYIGKFHLGEEEQPKKGFDLWASFPFLGAYFNQPIWVNGRKHNQKGFTDDIVSAMAADTISKWSQSQQPFCLVVGLKASHVPFTPPPRMDTFYQNHVFEEPSTFSMDFSKSKPGLKGNLIVAKTWAGGIPAYGNFQNWVRQYTRIAATLDESLATILNALEHSSAAKNTIVIFTSDQGYSLGELNLCEKHYAYEQVMRVPLLVKFPNQLKPGAAPSDLVSLEDIAATIYDYCLGSIPKEVTGKSWRSLQENKNKSNNFRDAVYFDFWHPDSVLLPSMQAVRTSRYKYIQYEYKPYTELYDLLKDPMEINNLSGNDSVASIARDLKSKLDRWKKKTSWGKRNTTELNTLFVIDSVQWASIHSNKGYRVEYSKNKFNTRLFSQPIQRSGKYFDIKPFKPTGDSVRVVYVAIPVNNLSKFDPFVYIDLGFPTDTSKYEVPVVGLYNNEEIYFNIGAEKLRGKPAASPVELRMRRIFDISYNPPINPGRSCVLFKMYLSSDTPNHLNVAVRGAQDYLKWL